MGGLIRVIIDSYTTAHLMDYPFQNKKFKTSISNHKAKNFTNAYMLPRSENKEDSMQEKDWKKAIKALCVDAEKYGQEKYSHWRGA